MPHDYHHTLIGYLTIIVFAVFFIIMAFLMAIYGFNWVGFAMILMVIALVLFATLTVTINADVLKIHFRPKDVFIERYYLLPGGKKSLVLRVGRSVDTTWLTV